MNITAKHIKVKSTMNKKNSQAGKGDSPRSCFSKKYKNNYDLIVWKNKKSLNILKNNETNNSKKPS